MIKVESLRVDYEGVIAVHDLSFQVSAGHIYGLVGPNGAGKTSTLKVMAGIFSPTYGDINIDGIDLDLSPQEALRRVGFMPDLTPVYENLKVWEYLEVFAAAYGCPRHERLARARLWAGRVRLLDKWDALIHTLSRGMRQRLVLAKTLLHDPKVLLLDEPASGLDPIGRAEMRDILKEVAAAGKAVVISSHILTELSDLCNAVGIMEKGRMVVSGTVEEIRARTGILSELVVRVCEMSPELREKAIAQMKSSELLAEVRDGAKGEICALFRGSEREASALLAGLVHSGIPVAEFIIKKADVEDIFLKIGVRETS